MSPVLHHLLLQKVETTTSEETEAHGGQGTIQGQIMGRTEIQTRSLVLCPCKLQKTCAKGEIQGLHMLAMCLPLGYTPAVFLQLCPLDSWNFPGDFHPYPWGGLGLQAPDVKPLSQEPPFQRSS